MVRSFRLRPSLALAASRDRQPDGERSSPRSTCCARRSTGSCRRPRRSAGPRVDLVLHLHRLQPQQRLARRAPRRPRRRRAGRPCPASARAATPPRPGGRVGEARHRRPAPPSRARSPHRTDRGSCATANRRRSPPTSRTTASGVASTSADVRRAGQAVPGVPVLDRRARSRPPGTSWSAAAATTLRHPLGSRPSTRAVARLAAAAASAAASAASRSVSTVASGAASVVEAVPVEERRVGVAGEERRVAQHPDQQVAVRGDAVHLRAGERGGQRAGGRRPGWAPPDHLGQHRVVVRLTTSTVDHAGVQPDSVVQCGELGGDAGDVEPVQRAAVWAPARPPGPRRRAGPRSRGRAAPAARPAATVLPRRRAAARPGPAR